MSELSLVFVNYNTRQLLSHALRNVFENPPKQSFQVIVVDNASSDGSADMVRRNFPHVDLVETGDNLGFAAGVNAGLAASEGTYIAILNPDIVLRGGEFDAMSDWMNKHPKVGLIAPRLLNPDKTVQYSTFRFLDVWKVIAVRRSPLRNTQWARTLEAWYRMEDFNRNNNAPIDWAIGGAMFVRQKAVADVGPMDTRFFMYFEDVDWCRRFWLAGWQVWYLASVSVIHLHSQESQLTPWYVFFSTRLARVHLWSGVKYMFKWTGKKLPKTLDQKHTNI